MKPECNNRKPHDLPQLRIHRAVLVVCSSMALMLCLASTAVAQDGQKQGQDDSVSRKALLVRKLESLRAAKSKREVQQAVHVAPTKPKELFLDLTETLPAPTSNSESPQAAAATLSVSMTSSPTQVVMRAVAWISIVLCVCCLVILGARHWQRQRGLLPVTTSRSRVMETLSLGPGRTVSLIEMHGYRALVATDAGGIRSLVLAPASFEDSLMHDVETTDEV